MHTPSSYLQVTTINVLDGTGVCLSVAMAKETEDRIKQLEEEVITLKMHVAAKDKGLEEEKKAIVDYMEKEFATHKLVMNEIVEGAKTEFTSQRFNLQKLYEVTSNELEGVKERLEQVEKNGYHHGKGKILAAKQMMPRVLDKQEDWKQWRSEVEDYCEEVMDGTWNFLVTVL